MLPSFAHLPLQNSCSISGRPPVLFPELLLLIRSFLVSRSLDSLVTISQWCAIDSKACDEKWYKHVLETCFGAAPRLEVPLEPDAEMVRRMVDGDFNLPVALGAGYWRRMLVSCMSELNQLPPLMSAAYLTSNEAQRARWASVFERRGMYALRARVLMADDPKPATERHEDFDYPHYRYFDGIDDEEKKARIGFMRGEKTTPAFEATVKKWIETGWKFDWLFGELLKTSLDRSYYWSARTVQGYIKVDDWISKLKFFHYSCFIPRMHMLLEHGIDHVIPLECLDLAIPIVSRIEREDHYQLEVLSSNIQLLIDYKIKVQSKSVLTGATVRLLVRAINAYTGLPTAIKRWEIKLATLAKRNNTDEYTKSTYIEHFRRYEVVVPQRLVELMVHLAHPHGNNDWRAARNYTMSHVIKGPFLSDAHKDALCRALGCE